MANLLRCLGLSLALLMARPAFAIDPPNGKVVLTLLGHVSEHNKGDAAAFDMAALNALPQYSFTMATPWYPQPMKFTGPLLRDVMNAAGASGTTLLAAGLDDYRINIPASDATSYDVIVTVKLNDKPMAVREHGPLFIVYPFDSDPALRAKMIYDRCIWQLKSITVQ